MCNDIYPQKNNDYSKLPALMFEVTEPIFLNYELRRNESTGRWDKIPKKINGQNARNNDPSTWCTLPEALHAYETRDDIHGVGIILIPPMCCIDLDQLRHPDTGELDTIAQDILRRVPSWAEVSASGTGIHIFCICNAPKFAHKQHDWMVDVEWYPGDIRKRAVEIYQEKRFMALTGNVITPELDIEDVTDEVVAVYDEYIGSYYKEADEQKNVFVIPVASDINVDERLKIALRSQSGPTIQKLMAGDISDYCNDHSKADMALLSYLAFWFECNPELMQEAFERSALANRVKWRNRPDYRMKSIEKAISATRDVYKADFRKTAAERRTAAALRGLSQVYGRR